MEVKEIPFAHLLSNVVDNRGKTCPTTDIGIPLIATNCIRNDILYPVYEKIRFVSQETYKTWFRGHPQPGDIIFVTKGTPGRVCIAPNPVNFCIAQDMVAIRADEKKIYPRYLFTVLRSPKIQRHIENMHVGTLIPHFKKGDFDKLLIPVPVQKTQKVIGDIYFHLCHKIELNQQMKRELEAIAQAIFKSWFVDFDPVRAKMEGRQPAGMDAATAALFPDSFEYSQVGEIPKEWKTARLGDVITLYDSQRIPLSNHERAQRQGKYPYYGAASVMDYVNDYLFNGVYILMEEDGSVIDNNDYPVIQYVWGKFWVNNHAHVLQGNNGVSNEHLMLFLKQSNIRPYVTGAVQPKLNQGNLRCIPFLLPSPEICNAFETHISRLYELFRDNHDQSYTLAAIRDTLLPKLMSGKIRVKEAEIILENVA